MRMKVTKFLIGMIIGLSLIFSFPAASISGQDLAYRHKSHKVYKHKPYKRPKSTYRGKPNPSWKYHKRAPVPPPRHYPRHYPKPVYRTPPPVVVVRPAPRIYRRPVHHHHGCFIESARE